MTTLKTAKKETNYTVAQETTLRAAAETNGGKLDKAAVDQLLTNPLFAGKTDRSIRAKASNMGIYKKQGKQSINGGDVVRKAEIVAKIEEAVGFSVDTFEAASKVQLEKMLAFVNKAA